MRSATQRMRDWRARPGNRERSNAGNRRRYSESAEIRAKQRENQRRRRGVATRPEPAKCELCGKPETYKGGQALAQDHCHLTGMFRGWLCRRCNQALGSFEDSPHLLLKAVKYLRDACNDPPAVA